ncbi:hypothetical protein ACTDI4_03395 [Mesorhizobium sp. PUT5]|uniref:hypothetical protein n=1 Tax=Mesorhizobium sp. PUT5 TaxID=3454629 RepID=UPI003FA45F9E
MRVIETRQAAAQATAHCADLEVVARLAAVIKDARLDCGCKPKLDETLARFAMLERRRTARGHLFNARGHREQIEAILFFLNDLDELETTEQDHSVYVDIALLFDDIANIAREGAYSMRQLSATVEDDRGTA